MHIAHFLHRYPPALGGAEAYFERLGQYLADCGDAVTVWTTTAVDLPAFWHRGYAELSPKVPEGFAQPGLPPVVRRYRPRRWLGRRYLLKAASMIPWRAWQCATAPCNPFVPGMLRDARRFNGPLDAVHATAFPFALPILCGLRLARRRRVPFFLTPFLHLGDPTTPRDRTRRQYTSAPLAWMLRQADGVFVQTHTEADAVRACGVPASRIIVQGLGVDATECTGGDREAARAAWGVAPHEVVIGHLANASVEKGTVDLLRASERLTAANVPFRIVLVGPEMPNFQRVWQSFRGQSRITRLGVLTAEQKRDFFAGIDLFALPSRTDSFGLVLLEAWANGTPCVVYRAGGPGELVRHGIDGLQAACGNVAELAEHLQTLVADASVRRKLGEAGRERTLRDFHWPETLALVRATLAEGSHGGGASPAARELLKNGERTEPDRAARPHCSRRTARGFDQDD